MLSSVLLRFLERLPFLTTNTGLLNTLDWTNGRSLFGRRYYEFAVDDLPRRTWLIHYHGGKYADAISRYPDGTTSLTGRCRIERTDSVVYPLIDDLADAISYTPTGTVAARVTEGSGKAILFYPNGNKNWEMTYEGFNRTGCLHFDEDGTLLSSSDSSHGTQDGE